MLYIPCERDERVFDTTKLGDIISRCSGAWQQEENIGATSRELEQNQVPGEDQKFGFLGAGVQAGSDKGLETQKPVS